MMNSYRQRNRTNTRLIAVSVFVVLIVAFDFLSGGAVRSVVRSGAALASVGVARTNEALELSGGIATRQALARENATLEQRVAELTALRFENGVLHAENDALRELVSLAESHTITTTRISSTPSASLYDTFLVHAGARDGVAVGDYVVAYNSIALGRVVEVSAGQSLVRALLAPNAELPILLGDDTPVTAIGRGSGNGRFEVPRGAAVAVGDIVLLPSRPFIAGVVGSVEVQPANALQQVYFNVPVNIEALRFVGIVHI